MVSPLALNAPVVPAHSLWAPLLCIDRQSRSLFTRDQRQEELHRIRIHVILRLDAIGFAQAEWPMLIHAAVDLEFLQIEDGGIGGGRKAVVGRFKRVDHRRRNQRGVELRASGCALADQVEACGAALGDRLPADLYFIAAPLGQEPTEGDGDRGVEFKGADVAAACGPDEAALIEPIDWRIGTCGGVTRVDGRIGGGHTLPAGRLNHCWDQGNSLRGAAVVGQRTKLAGRIKGRSEIPAAGSTIREIADQVSWGRVNTGSGRRRGTVDDDSIGDGGDGRTRISGTKDRITETSRIIDEGAVEDAVDTRAINNGAAACWIITGGDRTIAGERAVGDYTKTAAAADGATAASGCVSNVVGEGAVGDARETAAKMIDGAAAAAGGGHVFRKCAVVDAGNGAA